MRSPGLFGPRRAAFERRAHPAAQPRASPDQHPAARHPGTATPHRASGRAVSVKLVCKAPSRPKPEVPLSPLQTPAPDGHAPRPGVSRRVFPWLTAVHTAAIPSLAVLPDARAASYDSYAAAYDGLDDGTLASQLGFPALRQRLLSMAEGNVLECGIGTGINLPFYPYGTVATLTGLDASRAMLREAASKVQYLLAADRIQLTQGDVEDIVFPDASFDTVVDTFSLCVYRHPAQALAEMARVLKPGGRLLLLEHTRSNNPLLGAYQDATAAAVAGLSKGCVWNQDVPGLLAAAGLEALKEDRFVSGSVALIQATRA